MVLTALLMATAGMVRSWQWGGRPVEPAPLACTRRRPPSFEYPPSSTTPRPSDLGDDEDGDDDEGGEEAAAPLCVAASLSSSLSSSGVSSCFNTVLSGGINEAARVNRHGPLLSLSLLSSLSSCAPCLNTLTLIFGGFPALLDDVALDNTEEADEASIDDMPPPPPPPAAPLAWFVECRRVPVADERVLFAPKESTAGHLQSAFNTNGFVTPMILGGRRVSGDDPAALLPPSLRPREKPGRFMERRAEVEEEEEEEEEGEEPFPLLERQLSCRATTYMRGRREEGRGGVTGECVCWCTGMGCLPSR